MLIFELFCYFGVLFGGLGASWGGLGGVLGGLGTLLGGSWGGLGRSCGDLKATLGAFKFLIVFLMDFGRQKGAQREAFGEPKRSPRRPKIDHKIVLKNDRVLERS